LPALLPALVASLETEYAALRRSDALEQTAE
jgi:hypothetical protein